MTVDELRRVLQFYQGKTEVRFRDPVSGKLWPLGHTEDAMVWVSIHDDYNGRTGEAGHSALVLTKKGG